MWTLCVLSQPNLAVVLFSLCPACLVPLPQTFLELGWAEVDGSLRSLPAAEAPHLTFFPELEAPCEWPWVSGSWNCHAKCLWGATFSSSYPGLWLLRRNYITGAHGEPLVLGCWASSRRCFRRKNWSWGHRREPSWCVNEILTSEQLQHLEWMEIFAFLGNFVL